MAKSFWKCLKRDADDRSKFQKPGNLYATNRKYKPVRYQNTYRLESCSPFKIEPVDKIVEMVMTNHLEDAVYDATEAPKICSEISSEIRKRILKLEFDRHKIVVIVTLIEKSSQSLESSMGFIWDVQRDNYSTYTLETQTFYAYCCVFGVYYE